MKTSWMVVLVLILIFFGFLNKQEELRGFSKEKIFTCASAARFFEKPAAPSQMSEEIQSLLMHNFYYLGSGSQAYAFLSEDGKYVIKFFKAKHLEPKYWLYYLRHFPIARLFYDKKVLKREERCRRLIAGCHQAYEILPAETGVIYVHAEPQGSLPERIYLYDRSGCKHSLSPRDYVFVVQKSAQPLYFHLKECVEQGKIAQARQTLNALGNLVVERCKKGFIDRDLGVMANYGCTMDGVIQFDFGRITSDCIAQDPSFFESERERVIACLRKWIADNAADLSCIFTAVEQHENPGERDDADAYESQPTRNSLPN